jgi:hypothetical protein
MVVNVVMVVRVVMALGKRARILLVMVVSIVMVVRVAMALGKRARILLVMVVRVVMEIWIITMDTCKNVQ